MLGFLKTATTFVSVAALAYGAHWYLLGLKDQEIKKLNDTVAEQQSKNAQLALELSTQQIAAQICQQDLRDFEKRFRDQNVTVERITSTNQRLTEERDEYLSIFRRHDLTNLSRARPGLIEPRINNGTKEIFQQIEQDSKDTRNVAKDPDFTNFTYNRP